MYRPVRAAGFAVDTPMSAGAESPAQTPSLTVPTMEALRMLRTGLIAAAAIVLLAGPAAANPPLSVTFVQGVPRIEIEGDYVHSTYTVLRATHEAGPYLAITERDVLCLDACFVEDRTAVANVQYFYRFEILTPGAGAASYGPYPVTFSSALLRAVHARVFPNPVTGPATLEFYLGGEALDPGLPARAGLFDLQGRRVRELFRGTLPRGLTSLSWDGRDQSGRTLRSGIYFLRLETPAGESVTRVIRAR